MVLKYLRVKDMEIWMEVKDKQAVTTAIVTLDFDFPSSPFQAPLINTLIKNLYGSLLTRENLNILAFMHSHFPSQMIVFKK